MWNSNCDRTSNYKSASIDLQKIQADGRAELIELAIQFTSQHRDVDFADRDATRIVMSGHQPTLFHPGVWYKNFVLSSLGKQFNAYAINLIVDNDICTSTAVAIPIQSSETKVNIGRVFFDTNRQIVPHELRSIENRDQFQNFARELTSAIKPFVDLPVINKLWPYVLENQDSSLAIARGRHRLEADLGLQTLELPISSLAKTNAFAKFLTAILSRLPEFHEIYNSVIAEYRINHKIKNAHHPVPQLGRQEQWLETPFWVWSPTQPIRRSLFARLKESSVLVSDLDEFQHEIPLDLTHSTHELFQVNDIAIRPKALMTTLFSRLIASDLFIHGIGGSKYDQLTDEIAARYFRVELPHYLTTTATYRIQDKIKPIEKRNISSLQHQLRETVYHPEKFIGGDHELQVLAGEKQKWVRQQLPRGQRLQRHQAISRINEQLQSSAGQHAADLKSELENLKNNFLNAKILNSREYSFCVFAEELFSDLAQRIAK